MILKRPGDVTLVVQQELCLNAVLAVITPLAGVAVAALPKLKEPLAGLAGRPGAVLRFGV